MRRAGHKRHGWVELDNFLNFVVTNTINLQQKNRKNILSNACCLNGYFVLDLGVVGHALARLDVRSSVHMRLAG